MSELSNDADWHGEPAELLKRDRPAKEVALPEDDVWEIQATRFVD